MNMVENKMNDKLVELYNTYKKELYYIAYSVVKNTSDAEDILQDAFIRIAKNLHKIGEVKCNKTRGYLVIIVRNLSFSYYTNKKKSGQVEYNENIDVECEDAVTLEDYMINVEKGNKLAEAMSKLHPNYADILTLRYYYEFTIPEIAEQLGYSINQVNVTMFRARKALKNILLQEDYKYDEP